MEGFGPQGGVWSACRREVRRKEAGSVERGREPTVDSQRIGAKPQKGRVSGEMEM